jgi:DMSO/TMAO reductase YedYZ molybdopterin-dependent catalytic subunit
MARLVRRTATEADSSRREFMTRLAGAGAVVALSGSAVEGLAQEIPAAKPLVDPPGTVPNASVLAEKTPAMQPHSDRPLTASVPAEQHNYAVTPNDRMFIRNNHLTPDLDAGKHRLTVKGLVDRDLTYSLEELRLQGRETAVDRRPGVGR